MEVLSVALQSYIILDLPFFLFWQSLNVTNCRRAKQILQVGWSTLCRIVSTENDTLVWVCLLGSSSMQQTEICVVHSTSLCYWLEEQEVSNS